MEFKIKPIKVWRFDEASQDLQDLSTHGGDEDWIAVYPDLPTYEYVHWLENGGRFGCCSVSVHDHPTKEGCKVKIGAHA